MNLDDFADQILLDAQRAGVGDPLPQAIIVVSSKGAMPADPLAEAMGAAPSSEDLPPQPNARATVSLASIQQLPAHPIGADQRRGAAQLMDVSPDPDESGHMLHASQDDAAALDPTPPLEASSWMPTGDWLPQAAAAEELAAEIRLLHRRAVFCTAQRTAIGNRLAAFVRTEFLGFSTFDDKAAREKAVKAAQKIIATVRKGESLQMPADQAAAITAMVLGTDQAMKPFEDLEETCLKRMEKLVRALPGYQFMLGVRGFGPRSFARIIGEAGPLHRYANPAKLWKRLGVGVIGGERQRKYSDADMAAIHGYNPRRRSVSWVAFDSLFKSQGSGDDAGPYRVLYDYAKARYLEREWTKLHAHRGAARYAEKRLLKHLWRAWRAELRGQCGDADQTYHAPQALSGHSDSDALLAPAAHPIEGQVSSVDHSESALDHITGQAPDDAHRAPARDPLADAA